MTESVAMLAMFKRTASKLVAKSVIRKIHGRPSPAQTDFSAYLEGLKVDLRVWQWELR